MYTLNPDNISSGHANVCRLIIEQGEYLLTEDHAPTFELSEPVSIHLEHPLNNPIRNPNYPLSEQALKSYIPMMCEPGNINGHAYTYGDRMRNYMIVDEDWLEYPVDQIQFIIDQLKKNPTSRRSMAHTWIVGEDNNSKTPPCMQTVQFVVRNNCVNLIAYFRSNDMCMAWGANAYGLAHLQSKVASEISSNTGYLETISTCAHIYESDLQVAKRIAYG